MKQTPVHEHHNVDLLAAIPSDRRFIVEVGCSSGALAREYRKTSPGCRWIGIEIDPEYAELARRHCDEVHVLDIESAPEDFLKELLAADCWVFGDSLEHLKDPWGLLGRLRRTVSPGATVVACIPNMQHWSVQARLACGVFRYEDEGLLDRTHLRWFTRSTMIEMFMAAGYRIVAGRPQVFAEPERERVLPIIRELARVSGGNPEQAVADAKAMQFVITVEPC